MSCCLQTMDAQEGVLYYLLDQMADQHIKETLLAYVILLSSGIILSPAVHEESAAAQPDHADLHAHRCCCC